MMQQHKRGRAVACSIKKRASKQRIKLIHTSPQCCQIQQKSNGVVATQT